MDSDFRLTAWYINFRRMADIAGPQALSFHGRSFLVPNDCSRDQLEYDKMISVVSHNLQKWLKESNPEPIEKQILNGTTCEGKLFMAYRDFYFKGLPAASKYRNDLSTLPENKLPLIHAKLNAPGGKWRISLKYHPEHFLSNSAWSELRGRRRKFIFGHIQDIRDQAITAIPSIIADLVSSNHVFDGLPLSTYTEVHVDGIDSFAQVRDIERPPQSNIEVLRGISEAEIKQAFAEIIDECEIPKDWGGERSDLLTTHIQLEGKRVTAAFLLKGPSQFAPMTQATLGRKGDQIERLYSEPAELLILQHCHKVERSVRSAMRTYALQMGNIRRFCIIDGSDTLRILRAYRKCGQE